MKAHWVKDNADVYPPRTHDLQVLHNQTNLDLNSDDYDYFAIINQWNIESRYPDYREKFTELPPMNTCNYIMNE